MADIKDMIYQAKDKIVETGAAVGNAIADTGKQVKDSKVVDTVVNGVKASSDKVSEDAKKGADFISDNFKIGIKKVREKVDDIGRKHDTQEVCAEEIVIDVEAKEVETDVEETTDVVQKDRIKWKVNPFKKHSDAKAVEEESTSFANNVENSEKFSAADIQIEGIENIPLESGPVIKAIHDGKLAGTYVFKTILNGDNVDCLILRRTDVVPDYRGKGITMIVMDTIGEKYKIKIRMDALKTEGNRRMAEKILERDYASEL